MSTDKPSAIVPAQPATAAVEEREPAPLEPLPVALSLEQQIRPGLGAFLRLSANDGATESWAFTEIDRSAATGVVQDGGLWRRERDELGAAVVVTGWVGFMWVLWR